AIQEDIRARPPWLLLDGRDKGHQTRSPYASLVTAHPVSVRRGALIAAPAMRLRSPPPGRLARASALEGSITLAMLLDRTGSLLVLELFLVLFFLDGLRPEARALVQRCGFGGLANLALDLHSEVVVLDEEVA